MNKFILGCCYYPEHWDESRMRFDIARIKDLGFNTIRMGEFSWSMYEREEGQYDFSLLTKAVRLAEEAGLDVILGTPTAAPPKWLTDAHPEVLCKNAGGVTMQHGSRQHHNHTSEVYLLYCAAITEAMVKAFCGSANVIGWQIDNELNCHRNESYSETDDAAFQKWLEAKYRTVDALNEAWGTRFWSLEYNAFSQVRCPGVTTTYKNPSIMTDYYLFLSDTVVNYVSVQTRIIRKYMPHAFITHNGFFANIDYRKLTEECLDFLSYDCYPAFHEQRGIGLGRNAAYKLACTRGCSEKFLVLEQQSGPGGQLSYLLPTPLPGQIRLWTYQTIAHGAVGVLYFRYRTALYGAEQLWYGIYDHDGEENHRSREVRQIAGELGRLGHLFLQKRHCQVAILSDYHNACCNKAEPFFKDDSWSVFTALNRENIHADIIYTAEELDKYKVVIFPHIAIADEALCEKLKAFTESGGIAILSARSGVKDENAHYRPMKAPGVFRPITGCRAAWFTSMPEHTKQFVRMGEKTYGVETYYELLETEGAETVAVYTEGFCKDQPAAVRCGNVYYIGFYSASPADIYCDMIRRHVKADASLHKDLETVALGKHILCLNHSDQAVVCEGYDLLKESHFREVPPYGVVLLEKAGE